MNKRLLTTLYLFCCFIIQSIATEYNLSSPNGKLKMKVTTGKETKLEVWCNNYPLLLPSSIGMHLADGSFIGGKTKVTAQNSQTVNNKIEVPFGKNKILNLSLIHI